MMGLSVRILGACSGEFILLGAAPQARPPLIQHGLMAAPRKPPSIFSSLRSSSTVSRTKTGFAECRHGITERATLTTCDLRPAEAKAFSCLGRVVPCRSTTCLSLSHTEDANGMGRFLSDVHGCSPNAGKANG